MTTAEALTEIQSVARKRNDCIANISPVTEINLLADAGLLQIVLPGKKLDFAEKNAYGLLQILKAAGRADLSVGRIYEGHINALLLIDLFASADQKKKWFADAESGCLFSVWNTQANAGIEIIKTSGNGFQLTGKKTFASGADLVKRALITGNIGNEETKGWQMCLVNMDQIPDNRIDYDSWKPLGMSSSVSYTIDFTGYSGKESDLFGNPDDYYKQPFFSGGAIRFCAVQLGGAEALFNETICYLKTLQRTDDAYQQARVAEMATELASGNLWLQQAAANWDKWNTNELKNQQLIAFANMTRTITEKICLRVIELSIKCIGARGLMQPYGMERRVRDLQFYLRQPAPDAALKDVANYVIQSGNNIETMWNDEPII